MLAARKIAFSVLRKTYVINANKPSREDSFDKTGLMFQVNTTWTQIQLHLQRV